MNCPRRLVKINGKIKKVILQTPDALEVLDDNFSYKGYIEDLTAFHAGIKQGFFSEMDEQEINDIYKEDCSNKNYSKERAELYKKYCDDICLLQYFFEEGLNKGQNVESLDKEITGKMKVVALAHIEAIKVFNELIKEPAKCLGEPAKPLKESETENLSISENETIDWRDIPIKHLNRDLLNDTLHNAYRKLILLPNTPENFGEYTVRQLMDMNKEYLESSRGKGK